MGVFIPTVLAQMWTSEQKEKRRVQVYFVLPQEQVTYYKEGSELKCGDRLVPVTIEIESYPQSMVIEALGNLFAAKEETLAKLERKEKLLNPLKKAQLRVDSVKVPKYQMVINLIGKVYSRDTCELSAMRSQIQNTIAQFDAGATIMLNGNEDEFRCLGLTKQECEQFRGINLNSTQILPPLDAVDHNPYVKIY